MATSDAMRSQSSRVRELLLRDEVKVVLGGLFFLALPYVLGVFLASEILVYSVFALGFILLLGYTGLLSFGHAAYIGLGAYGTVISLHYLVTNYYVASIIGIAIATLAGAIFGYLSLRRRGIYFSMITLALAQMVYYIVFRWTSFTGGSNGIGIPNGTTASLGVGSPLESTVTFYFFALVIAALVFLGTMRVVNSPYGRTLIAIRENEERMTHLGFDTTTFLWSSFVLSAFICGIAGALYALLYSFVAPALLYWPTSGSVVMMALTGGLGTIGGAIVGSAIFNWASDFLSVLTDNWRVFFGAILVIVVLFAPQGVYGLAHEFVTGEREWSLSKLVESFRS